MSKINKNIKPEEGRPGDIKSPKKKNIFLRILIGIGIFLKYLFLATATAFVSFFVIAALYGFIVYSSFARDFKDAKTRNNSTQNTFYDKDEAVIYQSFGAKSPEKRELSEIPDLIKKATLASEDLGFYGHGAIDPKGIARAAYINYVNSSEVGFSKITNLFSEGSYTQGGSSITQQLVKNLYLTNEKSFDRKIREVVYAIEVEKRLSKDQILAEYLNNVYFGEQSLGIVNASRRYYGKEISELDLAEISMLVGLPASPTNLSPISGDLNAAKERQGYVLTKMYESGMITIEQAQEAQEERLYFNDQGTEITMKHPYYVDYVKKELSAILGEEALAQGGYTVYTNLDEQRQSQAEVTAADYMKKYASRKVTNAAAVILDNKEGLISGIVGGVDYEKSKVNVADSKRQPGSSFKPIVYTAGLLNGYTAASRLWDISINFGGTPAYRPKNYDGGYRGNVSVRTALANSLNIPAVEMTQLAGIDKVIQTAEKMGITSIKNSPESYGLSIGLGSAEVTPLELAKAYSVYANGGKMANFSTIKKVVDSEGKTVFEKKNVKTESIDEKVAYIMTSILSDNQARSLVFGTSSPLTLKNRPVAAKTGTTDDYADSWTMGFTPQYTVGVWMGNNDRTKMARVSGVEGAAYIWHDIIDAIHANIPAEEFKKAEGISEAWINPYTGGKTDNQRKPNYLEYFTPGTVPAEKPDFSYLNQFKR